MKSVTIELPSIKAISRNQTTGHWYNYFKQLKRAEQWMWAYGKRQEHHFENPVKVEVIAYYDARGRKKAADVPNVDDKIFTDILIRYKQRKKGKSIERNPWFIEDDNPKYLREVVKRVVPSDHQKVVIKITEVDDASSDQEGDI